MTRGASIRALSSVLAAHPHDVFGRSIQLLAIVADSLYQRSSLMLAEAMLLGAVFHPVEFIAGDAAAIPRVRFGLVV